MNKKIKIVSLLAVMTATPALAEPSNSSNSFPQSGVMEEDYTYVGQANVTNLKVSSGTATTTASYQQCPEGWRNTEANATSLDQCYKPCEVSDLPANSHAATASGNNYYGANVTDTCAIATCNVGYTFNPGGPDLMTLIGASEAGTGYGYKSNNGEDSSNTGTYGITQNGEFVVDYGATKGKIHGFARCSTQSGTNNWDGNTTTMTTLPDSAGQYCWCQLDGYTPNGQSMQSLSAPWAFFDDFSYASGGCASNCATSCGLLLRSDGAGDLLARAAMFGAITPSAPSCDANVINITWDSTDASEVEANNAGSVTYDGNINTPRKAQHRNGYIFTGWTFNTPNP